jgi:adenine phosphoribosyltransferase
VIDALSKRFVTSGVDVVVGIESRGFIFAGALAHQLNSGFVPVRKLGKRGRNSSPPRRKAGAS